MVRGGFDGLCAGAELLIATRALQGVGGALLTPGSLAILEASFVSEDRAAAIGAWSGFTGVATAIGPFLGGWLIQSFSWRLILVINAPVAVAVWWFSLHHVPERKTRTRRPGWTLSAPCSSLPVSLT